MATKLKVYDRKFMKALQGATGEGLARATQHYHSELKREVNTPNTGQRNRGKGGRYKKTTYPNPSKPGEPPRKRTGFGQRSIVREIDMKNIVARVGITAAGIYMFYLDQGTKHISRRPFILETLTKIRRVFIALLKTGAQKRGLN